MKNQEDICYNIFQCPQDYQFWTKADEEGYFSINNVRTGDYNLYAWVPGFVGDYRNDPLITITPGPTSGILFLWM